MLLNPFCEFSITLMPELQITQRATQHHPHKMLRPHKPSPLSLSPQHIMSQKLNEPWLAVKT